MSRTLWKVSYTSITGIGKEGADWINKYFDLNDDGVVDKKDVSLAGKVLASRRRKK